MAVIFRGDIRPKLKRYSIQYSPVNGYTRQYDYKGFSEQLMVNLMNQNTALGAEVTLTGEHDVYSLQIRDSSGNTTLDTWQIQQQDERPNCLSNPRNIANTTTYERAVIKRALDRSIPLQEALNQINDEGGIGYILPGAYGTRLYERMRDGATEFVRSIYILRHTTNAPSGYSANVADFNVDCIYTTAQLLTETKNQNSWLLPLPPGLEYFINNLTFPAVRSYYQNGWLKRGASRSTVANFRLELTTEYWSGQISTDEYALATGV